MNDLIQWLVDNPDFSVTFTLDTMNGSSVIVTIIHKPSREHSQSFIDASLLYAGNIWVILSSLRHDLALGL